MLVNEICHRIVFIIPLLLLSLLAGCGDDPAPTPVAVEPPPAEKPSDEEFVLKGVFVSANPDRSLALIADSNGMAKLYKPGQKLDDHYSLRSIGEKEVEILLIPDNVRSLQVVQK